MDYAAHQLNNDGRVVLIRFPNGNTYSCKKLLYKEYLTFKSLYDTLTIPSSRIDELVAQFVVLDKVFQDSEWLDSQYAGLCRTIANLSMYLATNHYDYGNLETFTQIVNAARMEVSAIDNVMFSTICRVYPGYQFTDLLNLPYPDIVKLFANAERFLLETGQIQDYIKFGHVDDINQPQTTQNTPAPAMPSHAPASGINKVDDQGRMVISDTEIAMSQRALKNDADLVMAHDKSIKNMVKQRALEQQKVKFNSPEGKRLLRERNKKISKQMRRDNKANQPKQKSFKARKNK